MSVPPYAYEYIFAGFAFVLGTMIGSFLNVCIYRMPLNLSVNNPRRSFCPHCKNQIPWYENLPLFSWVLLRGKCAKCAKPIPFRYFGVELLTGVFFLAIWIKCWKAEQWFLAFPFWILVSLLIVATFIDFDYFIIPDEITWGGVVAGVVLSFLIPPLMGQESHFSSGLWSLLGAGTGYFTLWGVVELGKLAFGKKRIQLSPAQAFTWTRKGEEAELQIGDEKMLWSELFSRESDQLLIHSSKAEVGGTNYGSSTLSFYYNRLTLGNETFELDKLDSLSGVATEIVIPREAMGFGDVKFIAAIGAFLGWKSVFFTVMAASITGAVVGILTIVLGKREWSAKIPFGPYLAFGAVLWLFSGPAILQWYLRLITPPTM